MSKKKDKIPLDLNTDFKILKSRTNIFEIGDINLPDYVLDLISRGLKFVPKFTKINLFYLIYNFYISLNRLNNSCIFKKPYVDKEPRTQIVSTVFKYLNKEYPRPTPLNYSLNFLNDFRIDYMKQILEKIKWIRMNIE